MLERPRGSWTETASGMGLSCLEEPRDRRSHTRRVQTSPRNRDCRATPSLDTRHTPGDTPHSPGAPRRATANDHETRRRCSIGHPTLRRDAIQGRDDRPTPAFALTTDSHGITLNEVKPLPEFRAG